MPSALTLHIVTPVTGVGLPHAPSLAAALGPEVSVTCSRIEHGPASIECELDEALAVPGTIAEVKAAAEAGADAVVINCMGDPGLAAARTDLGPGAGDSPDKHAPGRDAWSPVHHPHRA